MAILLLADHNNAVLGSSTPKAMTAALELGSDVHVLVAGEGCGPAADAAAKLKGVSKVLVAEAPHLANQLAEEMAALIVPLMANYEALVAPATAATKNVMPRVAAMLDVMQISDITAVKGPNTFERPIYAGNAIQTVETAEPKKVIDGSHGVLPGRRRRRQCDHREDLCARRRRSVGV